MSGPISGVTHIQPAAPSVAVQPKAPSKTQSQQPTDTVQISNAGKAALQESMETWKRAPKPCRKRHAATTKPRDSWPKKLPRSNQRKSKLRSKRRGRMPVQLVYRLRASAVLRAYFVEM